MIEPRKQARSEDRFARHADTDMTFVNSYFGTIDPDFDLLRETETDLITHIKDHGAL